MSSWRMATRGRTLNAPENGPGNQFNNTGHGPQYNNTGPGNQTIHQHYNADPAESLMKDLFITNPDRDKERIEMNGGGLVEDSCSWILTHQDFKLWLEAKQNKLLWVRGDPGKGKTMLLCSVINELKRTSCDKNQLLAFFFCQATDERLNNATCVLRGLIHTIFEEHSWLTKHALPEYRRTGKSIFADSNAWQTLSRVFEDILRDSDLPEAFIVIDALDECQKGQDELLHLLSRLSSSLPRVQWIVSSRKSWDVEEGLNSSTQKVMLSLELNPEAMSAAVVTYIQRRIRDLAKLKRYSAPLQTELETSLIERAENTFLWVALVCTRLSKVPHHKALQEVNSFPSGLDSLYGRMLQSIDANEDETEQSLQQRVLSIVLRAYKPVTLEELSCLDMQLCELVMEFEFDALRDVVESCGSFLTIKVDTVYLVHQSAKDFLTSQRAALLRLPSSLDEHRHLSKRSLEIMLQHLSRDMYNLRHPGFSRKDIAPPEPDPLTPIAYACVYWAKHLDQSNLAQIHADELEEAELIDQFLNQAFLFWLEALSLLGSYHEAIVSMITLKRFVEIQSNMMDMTELVQDAWQFTRQNTTTIEDYPLQVYHSALLFAPNHSIIASLYSEQAPEWISTNPRVGDDWDRHLYTLDGKGNELYNVEFSPDSQLLVANAGAGKELKVHVWNAVTGQLLQTIEDPKTRGFSISPDSTMLLTFAGRVFNLATGTLIKQLEKTRVSAYQQGMAFCSDVAQVVDIVMDLDITKGRRKIYRAFSISTGKLVNPCLAEMTLRPEESVSTYYASSKGQTLLSWDQQECSLVTLKGRNLQTRKILELGRPPHEVKLVGFRPDRGQVFFVFSDHRIKVLDTKTGACLQTLHVSGFEGGALLGLSNNLQLAVVRSRNYRGDIQIYDCFPTKSPQEAPINPSWRDWKRSFHAFQERNSAHDSEVLMTIDTARRVEAWDRKTGTCFKKLQPLPNAQLPRPVAFSSRKRGPDTLAYVLDSGKIEFSDRNGQQRGEIDLGKHCTALAFSRDAKYLALGHADGNITIWDIDAEKAFKTLELMGSITTIVFSRTPGILVSVSEIKDNSTGFAKDSVTVWNLQKEKHKVTLGETFVRVFPNSITFAPHSTHLAFTDRVGDGVDVLLWDWESDRFVKLYHNPEAVFSLSFDETGEWLRSVSDYGVATWCRVGFDSQPSEDTEQKVANFGLSFSRDRDWLTYNGEMLVRLPQKYRPSATGWPTFVQDCVVCLLTESRKLWAFEIDKGKTLRFLETLGT